MAVGTHYKDGEATFTTGATLAAKRTACCKLMCKNTNVAKAASTECDNQGCKIGFSFVESSAGKGACTKCATGLTTVGNKDATCSKACGAENPANACDTGPNFGAAAFVWNPKKRVQTNNAASCCESKCKT